MIVTQLDLFRNTGAPLQGVKSSIWGYAGQCFTAQAAIFHPESLDELDVVKAFWRVCWLPNITNGAQTAIRLCSADSGPNNLQQVVSTFSGGKPNSPLNEAFEITQQLRGLIDSHKPSGGSNTMFQLVHQSCGDGSFGAVIYSSSIEIILI